MESNSPNAEYGMENSENCGVKNFYKNRSVFITGVTGFLGGITLEKILRGCPEVNKVYVLIRQKRGSPEDVNMRLKKLLSSQLFSCHSQTNLEKVIAVPGNISSPNLGLSDTDRNKLIDEVTIVFHVAANINFSVELSYMVEVNLLGTKRILELCKAMKKIQAMVYVSTAYCNCTLRDRIAEKVYPSFCDVDNLLEQLKAAKPGEIVSRTTQIIGGHPNTYTFTKQLAENLIAKERGSIPVSIVRPSMVLGTLREPIVGWIDNVKTGTIAFIAGAAKGVFRAIFAKPDLIADMVPADKVANIIITSAWSVSKRENSFRVFHITSGLSNPISWGDYCRITIDNILKKPCSGAIWYPNAICQSMSSFRRIIHIWVFHYLQGVIVDVMAKLRGDKPILLDIQKKYFKGMEATKYFVGNEWKFDTTNTDLLQKELSPIEREEFCFDITSYKWPEFIADCLEGVKRFYYKENPNLGERAKKEIKMLKIVYVMQKIIFFVTVLLLLNFFLDDKYFLISCFLSAFFTIIFISL